MNSFLRKLPTTVRLTLSSRTVMHSDEFSYMQSQQTSTADRDCYNSSTCANRVIMKITLIAVWLCLQLSQV